MNMKVLLNIIFLFVHFICISQISYSSSSIIPRDSILKILEKSKEYLVRLSDPNHGKGIRLLDLAENLTDTMNDTNLKILVNRHRLGYYLTIRDTAMAKEYLKKNLILIKQINDKRELGLYYEGLGIVASFKKGTEGETEAFETASELLNKYGEKRDLIDANYNLGIIYKRKGEWQNSIDHSLISLNAIEDTGEKKNRRKYLYIHLAECFIRLNKYEDAKAYLTKIKTDEYFKIKDLRFLGFFYKVQGLYYEANKNYYLASQYYQKSSDKFYEYGFNRSKQISASLGLASRLKLNEEENKRIRVENKLNAEQLQNDKYVILLGALVILGLIIMSISQYRSSVFKTRTNKLLHENNKKLFKTGQKLDKALKAKSDFMDSVTHELLTPLNTIKGISFLLRKEKLTPKQQDKVKLLSSSSDHLLSLINKVIDLNVLEKDEAQLNKEEFDLKTLMYGIVDSLTTGRATTNTLHVKIDETIPDVLEGDILKISQVVINILSNSLKFTKDGDIYFQVSLVATVGGQSKVKFHIWDTGIGMSKKQKANVFDKFKQGSVKINRQYGGTGLGLTIVKKILDLYNSEINIDSRLRKGTSVDFSIDFDLPLKSKLKYQKNGAAKASGKDISDVNILLVEDNKVNQLIVKKIISDYGFGCDSANDGEEAVAMVKENKYSLILMDIMMPRMDGFEATRFIKSFNKTIPIVALTAISERLNKEKFNEVGILKILNKPVNPELLYETIIEYK